MNPVYLMNLKHKRQEKTRSIPSNKNSPNLIPTLKQKLNI